MTRSVEIPEEAVQAAVQAAWVSVDARWAGGSLPMTKSDMRAALEAALPYLVPAEPEEREQLWPADAYPEHMAPAPAGDGGLREALERVRGFILQMQAEPASEPGPLLLDDLRAIVDSHAASESPVDLRQVMEHYHRQFCEYDGQEDGVDVCAGECREFAEELGKVPAAPAVPQPATLPTCVNCESETFECSACGSLVEPWGSAVPQPVDREALKRLAEKWATMDTPGLSAPSNQEWATGVDQGYSNAAAELLAVLAGEQEQVEP